MAQKFMMKAEGSFEKDRAHDRSNYYFYWPVVHVRLHLCVMPESLLLHLACRDLYQ